MSAKILVVLARVGAIVSLSLVAGCGSPPAAQSQTPVAASSPVASPTQTSSPSASASPSPSPSPSPAASPSAASTGSIDLSACPAYAAGQHPLGSIGGPGAGVHADATLNWQGCGSITLPPGTARFMTGDNWQVGFAATCPNELNYGAGGMGPNVTFSEVLITGTPGPDSQSGAGPWTDSSTSIMAHGGNFQLRVTSIDPRCRWHVAVYSS